MKETKFKQTEVGMIPCDWEVKTLGSLTDKCSYGVGAEARVYCGYVKYIRITDIDDESHRFSPSPITSPSFFQEKHIVQKNDLLVARTGASVGKSYLYDEKDGKLVYAGFLMKLNVFNADSKYVFYNTLTKSYWNWVASESARTGQPGLNLQQMKLYSIALPPTIEEQQRIANALSDVDTLIANLEKLIAKKKNIKQGAMQQLLTGRVRLPGFGLDERRKEKKGNRHCSSNHDCCDLPMREQVPVQSNLARHCERSEAIQSSYKMTELGLIPSDWEVKNLGSITQNCSYGVGAEAVSFNGRTKYIRITDIDDDSHRFIPSPLTSPSFYENKHVVQENDLLIARTGASVGKTYLYDSKDGKLIFAGFLIKMNVCEANSKFVFYSTLTKYYQDWIVSESARTGQPGVNLQQMKKLQIALPPTIKEQQRIANVLSDMDTEIATLETKLAKYRKFKTGMMQQLLTGKIRLV